MAQIKPTIEALNSLEDHSFLIRKFEEVAFSSPYHLHSEFELTLIEKGEGKRYVGNHMAPYTEGDLVFLGPNLPHCWKTDIIKYDQINSCSIVIQFKNEFLGKTFLEKKGMEPIVDLLERSHNGLSFSKKMSESVKKNIQFLFKENDPFKRIIVLLEILHYLGKSKDFISLNQKKFCSGKRPAERARINAVMAYIVDNFKNEVSLQEAADIIGLSPNSFCKFFKKMTGKTLLETVINLRLKYAIQQLVQTDKLISDISFESGFGDLSHFHKLFKKKMGLSPLKYRRKFMDMIKE